MLQTFNTVQFLTLLYLTGATMRGRIHDGHGAFALGLRRNPTYGVYLVLDALAWLMASMLATEIGFRQAADVVRVSWTAWLRALQIVEDHWDAYVRGEISPSFQVVIGVAVTRDCPGSVIVGPLGEVAAKLKGFEAVRFVNVHSARWTLHQNSKQTGVPLPRRLTLSATDPSCKQWMEELETYRRLGSSGSRTS
jgi:hypothetical protein